MNEEVFYRRVGQVIYDARMKSGKSQEDLAKRLHVHQTAFSRIEKGQRKIQLHEWVIIKRSLHIKR